MTYTITYSYDIGKFSIKLGIKPPFMNEDGTIRTAAGRTIRIRRIKELKTIHTPIPLEGETVVDIIVDYSIGKLPDKYDGCDFVLNVIETEKQT